MKGRDDGDDVLVRCYILQRIQGHFFFSFPYFLLVFLWKKGGCVRGQERAEEDDKWDITVLRPNEDHVEEIGRDTSKILAL